MSRPTWMDRFHVFREDVTDSALCQCGIPATVHEAWELEQVENLT